MRTRIIVLIGLAVALAGAQAEAVPLPDVARERRSYYISAPPYAWSAIYDIEFVSQELHIYSSIHLYPINGVTQQQVDDLEPYWESGIEGAWNDRYQILHDSQDYYDIIYDVTFLDTYQSGVDHYQVQVRPGISQGNPRTTMTLWDTADTGQVVAHEYGHMIGNYDEYNGGATDPSNQIIDSSSIMGSTSPAAVSYARHYEPVLDWLESQYPSAVLDLVAVPEPATLGLVLLGALVVLTRRRAK